MIRNGNAIFFHRIRHIERTVSGPECLYRNGGWAVIRACIGYGDHRVLRSQHIQQFGRDRVLVTMVGQLHDPLLYYGVCARDFYDLLMC